MINKEWRYKEYSTSDQLHIQDEYDLPNIISKVMVARGLINRDLVKPFFYSNKEDLYEALHDYERRDRRFGRVNL